MRQQGEAPSTLPAASLPGQPLAGQCLSWAVWDAKCCCPCQGDVQHPEAGAERQDPWGGDGWWEGASPADEEDEGHRRRDFIPDTLQVLKRITAVPMSSLSFMWQRSVCLAVLGCAGHPVLPQSRSLFHSCVLMELFCKTRMAAKRYRYLYLFPGLCKHKPLEGLWCGKRAVASVMPVTEARCCRYVAAVVWVALSIKA